jgi:U4/U6 small nuclear ribonucleoprotein PRP4
MAEGGHIHYGSLEKVERERLSKLSQLEDETKRKLDKLKTQVVPKSNETHDLSEASQASIARQQELKEVIDRRKRARELAVPTNDNAVKLKLREYGEAIVIFGEQAPERRERLRDIMAQNMDLDAPLEEMRGAETIRDKQVHKKSAVRRDDEPKQKELFYSEGTVALKEARLWLCRYSMGKAMDRLEAERKQIEAQCNDVTSQESTQIGLEGELRGVQNQLSNFGDDRPISAVAFSPGSGLCATGSWSHMVKIWSVPDCKQVSTLRGHTERVAGLSWHPEATKGLSPSAANLVSGGCDGVAKLWSLDATEPVGELKGHAGRLSRVAFHPSGRYVGTTSFDTSWRLWDVESCRELLLQEGHTRALYGIAFHPDGSLVATAGLDCLIRLWDLRSGKAVQLLQGHVKQVLGLDFSPDGKMLASGSDDHSARLWDLRKKKCAYTIPGHSALISHVKFQPEHGHYLMTASYDNKVKLWSMRDHSLIKVMEGHEGRVMCADASDDGKYFATSAMDRTWKLWGR